MPFVKKRWTDRAAEFINRRLLTFEDGTTHLVTVSRSEGKVSVEGDGFNKTNMDDLEDRIEDGFNELNNALKTSDNLQFQFSTDGEGNYGYLGADGSFIPFKSDVTLKITGTVTACIGYYGSDGNKYEICSIAPTFVLEISSTGNYSIITSPVGNSSSVPSYENWDGTERPFTKIKELKITSIEVA